MTDPLPFGEYRFGTSTLGGGTRLRSKVIFGPVQFVVEAALNWAVEPIVVPTSSGSKWGSATWKRITGGTTGTGVWQPAIRWTDITPWVKSIATKSAHLQRLSGSYEAGSATIVLENTGGRFSPDNDVDSPYRIGNSTRIAIWRPIRVRAIYSDDTDSFDWPIFTGWIASWDESFPMHGHAGEVVISAVDSTGYLATFDSFPLITPLGDSELSGARIARILDAANFKGARFLDAGKHQMAATSLDGNIVTLLKITAESEGGAVWAGPDGAVHFDQKNALRLKERSTQMQVVFSDDGTYGSARAVAADSPPTIVRYNDLKMSYDGGLVQNQASYARVGGLEQYAEHTDSVTVYGDHRLSRSDLICSTDYEARSLAKYDVIVYGNPERRIESVTFTPFNQGANQQQVLRAMASQRFQLRALARVRLNPTSADYTLERDVFVQGIDHNITRTMWTVTAAFSSAAAYTSRTVYRWNEAKWGTPTTWTFG